MQFSSVIVALLASTVAADLHTRLTCLNYSQSVLGAGASQAGTNDAATIAACNAYKRRNTGNKQWDTCPDCTVIQNNQIKACQSNGKHLGGDEFLFYCKQNGANSAA
ncbi:hypothetical protein ONS95_012256 [Cadophora gregata]|uniref:uncharacterized protein n=1 Tax=Cadophora gregata TaxID=51156 RepID=UPI0026DC9A84|nr:uncharacterized protein ONS95_012256 [Cadophora gregata]KAK0117944.1 hypothetical protein ONS95_012256 [Cadophora gregata]KAK0123007.1 hypothetical protein ONS96_010020 [Cadophora gregata f. sp. sojae]